MMSKAQNSGISAGIGRIFSLSALLFILSVSSCTAGDHKKKAPLAAPAPLSLQEQLRNSPDFQAFPLKKSVDSLVVCKSKRLMYVYHKGEQIKAYVVSLGQVPVGKKQFQGDNKTPEGLYYINGRNAASAYYKNLGVAYPNSADRDYARSKGLSPGGDVKIHGLPLRPRYPQEAYLYSDWTWGCIAVSNAEMDELFTYVTPRAALLILP